MSILVTLHLTWVAPPLYPELQEWTCHKFIISNHLLITLACTSTQSCLLAFALPLCVCYIFNSLSFFLRNTCRCIINIVVNQSSIFNNWSKLKASVHSMCVVLQISQCKHYGKFKFNDKTHNYSNTYSYTLCIKLRWLLKRSLTPSLHQKICNSWRNKHQRCVGTEPNKKVCRFQLLRVSSLVPRPS